MDSSLMDSRRRLVLEVEGGMSLSAACVLSGVTRKTGLKWMNRAAEMGLDGMQEKSRARKVAPLRTDADVESALLELKTKHPYWGARKLVLLLERESGIHLPSRTADRILFRHGLTRKAAPRLLDPIRFERETCGALLQMDFKGLPKTSPYALLTVLDDHARFCLSFAPIKDKTGPSVQEALWEVFGEHGLPVSMLMDNGDCWGSVSSMGPTAFEAWLMRLGILPIHGRAMHPQTQGKVERFHLTAKVEVGEGLLQSSAEKLRPICKEFVDRYNWVRPHDALGGEVPGSAYAPFPKVRPKEMPAHEIPSGTVSRKVDVNGCFTYEGQEIRIGKGLIGERIVLKEEELGKRVFYAGFPLASLAELKVKGMR